MPTVTPDSQTIADDNCVESYSPPAKFTENANATAELYDEARAERLEFWAKQANRLSWETPFGEVLDWSEAPVAGSRRETTDKPKSLLV